jgi:UDP-N-acetylmuramoylalanine--D-glutamate ligase
MEAVRNGLRSFPGVKHRLERVALKHGVAYVNDSKATNVASAVVALQALAGSGPIHLIAGGQGKGQDFSALRAPVQAACAGVYLIGEDAPALGQALAGVDVPVADCGTLEVALERASSAARQAIAAQRWVKAARRGPRAAAELAQAAAAEGAAVSEPEQVVLLAPGCASFDQFADFEARGERFRELVAEI